MNLVKKLLIGCFVFLSVSVCRADIVGPTGSFIKNSVSSQTATFNVSSGTVRNQLKVDSILFLRDGTVQVTSAPVSGGGGGGSGTSVYPASATASFPYGLSASTLNITGLGSGVLHTVSGNVITSLVSLSSSVTGVLPLVNMSSGATYYIQNTNTLQSGSTFYVSSGTVAGKFYISRNDSSFPSDSSFILENNSGAGAGTSVGADYKMGNTFSGISTWGRIQNVIGNDNGGGNSNSSFQFYVVDEDVLSNILSLSGSSSSSAPQVYFGINGTRFQFLSNLGATSEMYGSGTSLVFEPYSGAFNEISLVQIGSGRTGVDYGINFDGQDNDGQFRWMEDENRFDFDDSVNFLGQKEVRFSDADSSHYVAFKSSAVITSSNTYVWMPSSGPAGRAIITDGRNNFSFGLSSAASNTTENNFPMGDSSGSLQPSSLNYLPSYPLFIGTVIYGDNILAIGDMGGLTASLINGALNAKMSFGVGSGFTTSYRANVPDTPPGAYQAWTSTGPTGNQFQFQNTTVIVSTSGLQSGATFFVSSGSVAGKLTTNEFVVTGATISIGGVTYPPFGTNTTNVIKYASTSTAVVGGTTAEKSLNGFGVGSSTFVAGSFTQGHTFRVQAMGHYEQGTANVTFRLKVGTVTVGNSGAQVLGSGIKSWTFDSLVTIRQTGAAGNLSAQSYFFPQVSGSDIMFGLTNTTTHFVNTLIDNPVTLTAQFDAVDSTVTATNFLIDSLIVSTAVFANTKPVSEKLMLVSGLWPVEASADSFAPISVTTGAVLDSITADFDSATDQCRGGSFVVPYDVDASSNAVVSIDWMSISTGTGNVGWYLKHNSGVLPKSTRWEDTSILQSHATSFDAVATSTGAYARSSFELAMSSYGWVSGDNVLFSICRDADNASDTMTGVAKGIMLRFMFWRN